jgi:acetyltransferase-like isoleucine patch superfamily enzyme
LDKKKKRRILKPKEDVVKDEVELKFYQYIFLFIGNYFFAWVFAGLFFFPYLVAYFIPNFLNNHNFFLIFTNLHSLIAFLTMPIALIITYLLHIFGSALFTRIIWRFTEKKSPSKDGIIPRNISSKTLNYYHIRSFIIKYIKNLAVKGIFPYLANSIFRFIGSVEIGKGTTMEEEVCGARYIDVGENCYVGPNVSLASHLVEGIFGNIYYFKIILGDNTTLAGESALGPGTELKNNSYVFPMGANLKFNVNKGENYYFGMLIRKIFSRKLKKYLKVNDEDLEKAEKLEEKQVKENRNNEAN